MKKRLIGVLMAAAMAFALCGLSAGDLAPDFSAKNQDGKVIRLSDYRGKIVLLYFYPKDETPGCTKEACEIRDQFEKFQKAGVVVLGVSTQDEKSHQSFREHHKIPFDLIADTDGAVAKLYGVGHMFLIGLDHRESVLIGPDGKVAQFYQNVDPDKHAAQVLKDVSEIKK
jgi:peroxiredoxin Q/BCP